MDAPKSVKRRKVTDKSLPSSIARMPEYAVDSKMYKDLQEMERRLDWTIMRKKLEIQDALGRPSSATRTLRIFVSHTVSGQAWQTSADAGGSKEVNFDTGTGIPAWSLKVEGRLLEVPGQRASKVPTRKFSAFIRRMVIEMDREHAAYSEGNIVEWVNGPNTAPVDGFNLRRTGDRPINLRIVLAIEHQPDQYKVSPQLASLLNIKEDNRTSIIQALWNYIKLENLQDKVDRRQIRPDARLAQLLGTQDPIPFQRLPELVNRHLAPADPIVLHYHINTEEAPPPMRAFDVEVKMDDLHLKTRMNGVMVNMSAESAAELQKMDEEITLHAQSIHNSVQKRTFLHSFAQDPAHFIQTWLASQAKDLESVLGSGPSEGASMREDELRRSEFFRLPWVEEAIAIQEGMRKASALAGTG